MLRTELDAKKIAETILYQVRATAGASVFYSWGVSDIYATTYNDMITLVLKVSGVVFKGLVCISLNEGLDTYEITLLNPETLDPVKKIDDVYFDMLGATIDNLIERPAYMTDEEYSTLALADSGVLI